jgi:hypothetical protein
LSPEIKEKFTELIANYQQLTEHYRSIAQFGDEEALLIDQGDMESLLDILREKEEIMVDVTRCQEAIGKSQDFIIRFYQLESFSLSQLMDLIERDSRDLVVRLKHEIKQLIKQLEILEQQERIHESMLRSYADQVNKIQGERKNSAGKKAYEKMIKIKDEDSDIDIKR